MSIRDVLTSFPSRPCGLPLTILLWTPLIVLNVGVASFGQDKLKPILEDWQRRQQTMVTVRYTYEGRCVVPKGTHTGNPMLGERVHGDIPPEDYTFTQKITLSLDFEKNWVRKEIEEERLWLEDGKFYPVYEVRLYDGKDFQEYKPAKKNRIGGQPPQPYQVELDLQTERYSQFTFENSEYPLFFAHGVFPSGNATISPKLLRIPRDPGWFSYHGHAPSKDRECVILRTRAHSNGAYSEYWIDPSQESGVVRWILYSKEHPTAAIDTSYRKTQAGWIPDKWTWVQFDPTGNTRLTNRYELVNFEPNAVLQKRDFHVERTPGMIVNDVTKDRVYQVGQPGQPDIDIAMLRAAEKPSSQRSRWAWRIGLSLVVGLGTASGVWWLRYRRSTVK